MSNKRKITILVISIILLIAGWTAFHFLSGSEKTNATQSSNNESDHDEVDHDATAAVADDLADSETPAKTVASGNAFPEALKRCFPQLAGKINSPQAFVDNWKSENPKFREDLDFIHYFFKDKLGKEIRGQIVYLETNDRPVRQLKLFRVLSDGLPDPVEIPEADKFNPSDTTLSKYIDFNTVFETQKKWTARVNQTTHIEVEESNSQITEFQLYHDELIFRCHEGDCECKTKD